MSPCAGSNEVQRISVRAAPVLRLAADPDRPVTVRIDAGAAHLFVSKADGRM